MLDGRRPANPYVENPESIFIITPVVIEIDGPPLVNRDRIGPAARQVVITGFGGQVGQDTVVSILSQSSD